MTTRLRPLADALLAPNVATIHRWASLFVGALAIVTAACAARPHPVIREAQRIPFTASGYERIEGDEYTPALEDLTAKLTSLGVTIEDVPEEKMQGAEGATDPENRHIWMTSTFSPNTRFEVLAHEAGHLYQPRYISRNGAEIFAELVFWELAKHYKIDVTRRVARYLAGYKEALVLEPALRIDVKNAVSLILGAKQVWD